MLVETFITYAPFGSFLNNLIVAVRCAFVKDFLFNFELF